ncbi:MAG: archease [Candidatus Micrarchaeales archaeon]
MPRANFRYIPNTADVAFIAYGKTFKEALENAGSALLNTMFDIKAVRKSETKAKTIRIHDSGISKEEITWFILQEIVSKIDEKGVQGFDFKINHIQEQNGKVKVNGCIFYKKTKEYLSLLDVKAVTPHDLQVKKNGKIWSIRAILDV